MNVETHFNNAINFEMSIVEKVAKDFVFLCLVFCLRFCRMNRIGVTFFLLLKKRVLSKGEQKFP